MKYLAFIILAFCGLHNQEDTIDHNSLPSTNSDCENIVLIDYVNGKPYMKYIETSEKVAKIWGFELQHEFGSCIRPSTEKVKLRIEEVNKLNVSAQKCLKQKFGDNWQEKFHQEVLSELNKEGE